MEIKKSLVCKCGKQAKFIQMLTFSYHYCEACKIEVEEPKKDLTGRWADTEHVSDFNDTTAYAMTGIQLSGGPPLPYTNTKIRRFTSSAPGGMPAPPPNTGTLPSGYVALKGESVICDQCGAEHGTLQQDLPDPAGPRWSAGAYIAYIPRTHFCCPAGMSVKFDSLSLVEKIRVKYRGWV